MILNARNFRTKTHNLPSVLVLILFALLLIFPTSANAQAEGLTITAEAGLDGFCKEGAWLPVRVTVENNGADVDGVLYAGTTNTQQNWRFNMDISLPSVSRKEWVVYVFPLGREDEITVGIVDGSRTLSETTVPVNCVPQDDMLLGVWAANPSIFNTQTTIQSASGRSTLVQVNEHVLPDRPEGLSMLDTLTISEVDTGSLSEAQRDAIAAWVANGGRLLIAGGADWQKTAAGLAPLLPLQPNGTMTLTELPSIQVFTRSDLQLSGTAIAAVGNLVPGSDVLVSQDGVPLIISRPHGFGSIIYFAVDPSLEPLRTWIGMEELYQFMLGAPLDVPSWRNGFSDWFEANEALNAIPGLTMPSAWLVCGFLIVYLGVVGPLNFLLLRSIKKRELAWITIPLIVVFFSGFMFLIGSSVLGNRPVVNRMSIVEIWPGEENAQVHGLIGVFSPSRETFDFDMGGGFIAHPPPTTSFNSIGPLQNVFQTDTGFKIPEMRVDIGGLDSYVIAGQIQAPAFEHVLLFSNVNSTSSRLTGSVTNSSNLALTDAMILTGGNSLVIGDFNPGDTFQVTSLLSGSSSSATGTTQVLGPPGISDDTLLEIFGTNYMFPSSFNGLEDYRRFNLLSSALGGTIGSRGNGVFLIGWTDQAPFETNLGGGLEKNADTTLYIVHLRPDIEFTPDAAGDIRFSPEQFSWSVFGTTTGSNNASAYDAYIRSGSFDLQYTPHNYPGQVTVKNLTMHLESYGDTGPVGLDVQLWDFDLDIWVTLLDLRWGDTSISSPERFVGPSGQIRLRLASVSSDEIDVERADFTLIVNP